MTSVNQVFQTANRLASIGKGSSLNERDKSTRFVFDGVACEIVSGGLFAIAGVTLPCPVQLSKPLEFEINNEMLRSVADAYNLEDLQVEGIYLDGQIQTQGINLKAKGVLLTLPNKSLWSGFAFSSTGDVDFVTVETSVMSAVFESAPKLRQDSSEKQMLSAMKIEVRDDRMTVLSTSDKRMMVRISAPCDGMRLNQILLPFAIVPLLRWALDSFGDETCLIGIHGETVVFCCGPFHCFIKQIASTFPFTTELMNRFTSRTMHENYIRTSELASAARQSRNLSHQSCTLQINSNPKYISGDASETFSSDLDLRNECIGVGDCELSLDSSYMVSAMTCLEKLKFTDAKINYVNSASPVLFSASSKSIEADIAIATVDRVVIEQFIDGKSKKKK